MFNSYAIIFKTKKIKYDNILLVKDNVNVKKLLDSNQHPKVKLDGQFKKRGKGRIFHSCEDLL